MWEVEEVPGTLNGTSFLIKNRANGGYLALNGPGGGALHFRNRTASDLVCDMLNRSDVR